MLTAIVTGTIAVTQAPATNNTTVATTAFVLANAVGTLQTVTNAGNSTTNSITTTGQLVVGTAPITSTVQAGQITIILASTSVSTFQQLLLLLQNAPRTARLHTLVLKTITIVLSK